ncbi:MAG TPA: helix-turn-helix domain-containing protein [Xanthobacteraceae bacterium]|nr:helix-turn-helix domain-containing protein [Xanthobacteraceae bacterium]
MPSRPICDNVPQARHTKQIPADDRHECSRGRTGRETQDRSQGDLAAMAGIARQNLSRILQEWMRDALIKRLASYYCVENKAALGREAEN